MAFVSARKLELIFKGKERRLMMLDCRRAVSVKTSIVSKIAATVKENRCWLILSTLDEV